ncbi:hypothetical protein ES702_02343 [subsurface metagenome]
MVIPGLIDRKVHSPLLVLLRRTDLVLMTCQVPPHQSL